VTRLIEEPEVLGEDLRRVPEEHSRLLAKCRRTREELAMLRMKCFEAQVVAAHRRCAFEPPDLEANLLISSQFSEELLTGRH
jgi:hypothetical protein